MIYFLECYFKKGGYKQGW